MQKIDLSDLSWHRLSEAGSSGGSLYKAIRNIDGINHFYKMSMMIGRKVVGHEAANEVIVSRLLDILKIPHVHYELYEAKVCIKESVLDTFICESIDFKAPGTDSIPFELYHQLCGQSSDPLNFALSLRFSRYLDQLFAVDFLIANRDRHGYNLELLKINNKLELAPLFDMGYSLVAPLQNDMNLVRAFNPMQDVNANNYIGSESLFENLKLIQHPVQVAPLLPVDKKRIFYDMSRVISHEHIAKIWDIIWLRYSYLVDHKYFHVVAEGHTAYF